MLLFWGLWTVWLTWLPAIAATLAEEANTLEEMVEPYLLKIGFLTRTKRGRMVSREAYKHLGISYKGFAQGDLFK